MTNALPIDEVTGLERAAPIKARDEKANCTTTHHRAGIAYTIGPYAEGMTGDPLPQMIAQKIADIAIDAKKNAAKAGLRRSNIVISATSPPQIALCTPYSLAP